MRTEIIGRYHGAAQTFGIVVHYVVCPCLIRIVHMGDEESRSRGIAVPFLFLVVVQDVAFAAIGTVVDDIGFGSIADALHPLHGLGSGEFGEGHPSRKSALVGGVGTGCAATVVVATVVHQAPPAHTHIGLVIARGVVEVGQTQTVGELVTHRTDAIGHVAARSVQLRRAGVGVDNHSVERHS